MKKILSMLIAVIMVLSMFPAMIFTSSADDPVAMIGDVGYTDLQAAVDAAPAGDTVVLVQDVTLPADSFITINKSLTLDLDGKTLEGSVTNAKGLIHSTTAQEIDLTIKNGSLKNTTTLSKTMYGVFGSGAFCNLTLENCNMTVSSAGFAYGVNLYASTAAYKIGSLTVKNCEITLSGSYVYGIRHHTNSAGELEVTVENTTINVNATSSAYGIYTNNVKNVQLSGNTVEVNTTATTAYGYNATGKISGSAEISDNTIKLSAAGTAYPVKSTSTVITLNDKEYNVSSGTPGFGNVKVAGGSFNFEVAEEFCAPGFSCVKVGDSYTVTDEVTTENNAVMATKDTETRYFGTLSDAVNVCGDGWTLTVNEDLEDRTIGSSSEPVAADIVIKGGVTLTSNTVYANNLTVEDSATLLLNGGIGTLSAGGINNGTIIMTDDATAIKLKNFTNNGSIIFKETERTYGSFRLTDNGNVVNNGTISCEGTGENNCILNVSANGISGENPYTQGSYYWDYENSVWYMGGTVVICSPDGSEKYFENFSVAYDAAKDGDTLVLNADQKNTRFNNSSNIVEKNITVDLNGYVLSARCDSDKPRFAIGITGEHTLTIIDSSEDNSGNIVTNGRSFSFSNYNILVDNGGTLILDGVNLSGADTIIFSQGGSATPDTIVIKDSTLKAAITAVNHNGTYYGADVTVENSTVETEYWAFFLSGQDNLEKNKLKVVDSTVTAATAIETKYSDVEIINSAISSTEPEANYQNNGSGSCALGFAIVSTDNGKPNSTGSIKISGENTVITGYVGLETSGLDAVKDVKTDVQISGGKFNREIPAEYCAEGFEPVQDEDGNYVVREEEKPAVTSFKIKPADDTPAVLYPGDTVQMVPYDIQPAGAELGEIEWSIEKSGGKSYYSIDENGLVKIQKAVTITYNVVATVTNKDGTTVSAKGCPGKTTALPNLTISSDHLNVGESAVISTEELKAIGVENITFTVDDIYNDYISVDEDEGTLTVTARFSDEVSKSIPISVNGTRNGAAVSRSTNVSVQRDMNNSIGDGRNTINICVGQNIKFDAPSAFAGHDTVWSVSDENMLQVDQEGNLTVKATGETLKAAIYATAIIDGVEYKSCTPLQVYEKVVAEVTVKGVTYQEHTIFNALSRIPPGTGSTGEIKLLSDITVDTQIQIYRKDVTIDFGDYVLTSTYEGSSAILVYYNNTKLIINAGKGGIVSESNAIDVGRRLTPSNTVQPAILTVNGGRYISNGTECIYVAAGEAVINDGYFELKSSNKTYLINCNDDSRKEGNAKITVNGGTFVDFDPQNNAAEGKGTNFLAPGLESYVDKNGNYVVREKIFDPQVNTQISFTIGNTMTLNLFVEDSVYGNAYNAEHCTAYVDAWIDGEWIELGSDTVVPATDATVDGDTANMKFSVGGIPMAYLSNDLRVRFYAYGDKTYELELTELSDDVALSFVSYAERAKELNPENASLITLLNTMLNYTAAVQQYKSHNVENLANAGLTDEEKAMTSIVGMDFSEYSGALKRGVSSSASATVTFDGSQLLMSSDKTGFQFYFTLAEGVDVSALELQVKYNGKTVKIPAATFKSRGNGQYSAIFEGLDPTEFDAQITAAVFEGSTRVSNVAYDSIPATAKLVSEDARYASMVDIYSGMLAYCKAAKAYNEGV